jgi:hypothetical protein
MRRLHSGRSRQCPLSPNGDVAWLHQLNGAQLPRRAFAGREREGVVCFIPYSLFTGTGECVH